MRPRKVTTFLFCLAWIGYCQEFGVERHDGVVDGGDFRGVDTVVVDYRLPGEVAHGDYMVGVCHAVALDAVHGGVGLAAGAVVFGSVHVHHQRLSGYLLGMYAGGVCEPVVAVDYVEVESAGYHACGYRVIVDFLQKVVGVSAGELYASQVVGAHVVEVGVDVVAQGEVQFRRHQFAYSCVDVFAVDLPPGHGHLRCADYACEGTVFVAVGFGNDECYVHVAAFPHAAS